MFRSILTEVFDRFEINLQAILDKYLAESDRQLLAELLDKKQLSRPRNGLRFFLILLSYVDRLD